MTNRGAGSREETFRQTRSVAGAWRLADAPCLVQPGSLPAGCRFAQH
jgi:hypothetical protein